MWGRTRFDEQLETMNLLAFHHSMRYVRAFDAFDASDGRLLGAGTFLPLFSDACAQSVVPVVGAHARGAPAP
jgi:hypothetical protein